MFGCSMFELSFRVFRLAYVNFETGVRAELPLCPVSCLGDWNYVMLCSPPMHSTIYYSLRIFQGYWTRRKTNLTYLLTYLLTPWSRVPLKNLNGSHLVKRFPEFYRTRRFIITFTSARQLSLSWASSTQSIPPHPTSWRSILVLSSHLRLGLLSGSFPTISPPKPCILLSYPPYALHASPIWFFIPQTNKL